LTFELPPENKAEHKIRVAAIKSIPPGQGKGDKYLWIYCSPYLADIESILDMDAFGGH
jgi:hypothetical protein